MYLRFSPAYAVSYIEEIDSLSLISERDEIVLSGSFYKKLYHYIKNKSALSDILDDLNSAEECASFLYTVDELVNLKYIEKIQDFKFINNKPKSLSINVINYSRFTNDELDKYCKQHDIKNVENSQLSIVFVDDFLDPKLSEVNLKLMKLKRRWLLCKPAGEIIWISPVFRSIIGKCYECFKIKLQQNAVLKSFLVDKKIFSLKDIPLQFSKSSLHLIFGMLHNIIINDLENAPADKEDYLIRFDTVNFNIVKDIFLNTPQCVVCGDKKAEKNTQVPIKFTSSGQLLAPTNLPSPGEDRSVDLETLYDKLQKYISPAIGKINEVTRQGKGIPDILYLYTAKHFIQAPIETIGSLIAVMNMSSGGKGKTCLEAKVGAICEGLERYSGNYQGYEYCIKGSFNDLQNRALNPETLMMYSTRQYDNNIALTKKHSRNQRVPRAFNRDTSMRWTEVFSLSEPGVKKLVPLAWSYYGIADMNENLYTHADSNGVAAGSSIEEAIFHGLLEVFERDAAAIWWYNEISCKEVCLASLENDYINALIKYYESIGRRLWVLDITNDIGVPAFAAISATIKKGDQIIYGLGCHFDAAKAICAAIMEVNQTYACIAPGGPRYAINSDGERWIKESTLEKQSYLLPRLNSNKKKISDYEQYNYTIIEAINITIENLKKKNLNVYFLDQSRPDIELKVCKAIVPGLRHFWMRFAPGRLYEVPVQLGWLKKPKMESQLNPYPIFF